MRKVFVTLCQADTPTYLSNGINSVIYYAPIYEHAYKKIENAVGVLGLDYEVVRASSGIVPGSVTEFNAGLEDIVIFASPYVFLAKNADVEGAINYVTKTDVGYSTVGTPKSLYMTVGTAKMISKRSVTSTSEFVSAMTEGGAHCANANFADKEESMPKNKLDFHQKCENYRREYLESLFRLGVDIEALDGIVVSPTSKVEPGSKLNTGCHIYGNSVVCKGAIIGQGAIIKDSTIGENTTVGSSHIFDSVLEKNVCVDSFCIIKDKSHLISGVKVASHCEISNTILLNDSSVASHSHIWDTEVGARTIIGSGVITINYEVNRKQSKCKIGDDVIVGCGSSLVLPIEIGTGAFVAAGSTVTDDVPNNALAIAREYQSNVNGWAKNKINGKHI